MKKFCVNPWLYCEIHSGGEVYNCCPRWVNEVSLGNIFTSTPEEVWNSHLSQQFRSGILDGSFDKCNSHKCPHILQDTLPTTFEARNMWFGSVVSDAIDNNRLVSSTGPAVVKLGYDASCNLSCPSCRPHIIVAKKEEQKRLAEVRDRFIIPFLKDTTSLVLSSDGDPFASNHYREIMQLTYKKFPNLKLCLHTNGVLLDEKAWDDCHLEGRVTNIEISIDAATKETYQYVRRGGDFDRLIKNLEFISKKRKSSQAFTTFNLLFVVQPKNFQEIPDFVRLAKKFSVDEVKFMRIAQWDRAVTQNEYQALRIWDKNHPHNKQFLSILESVELRDAIVNRGDLLSDEIDP